MRTTIVSRAGVKGRGTVALVALVCTLFSAKAVHASSGVLLLQQSGKSVCHAVLVDGRRALTARHCVSEQDVHTLRLIEPQRGASVSVQKVLPITSGVTSLDPFDLTLDVAWLILSRDVAWPCATLAAESGVPTMVVVVQSKSVTREPGPRFMVRRLSIGPSAWSGALAFAKRSLCNGDSGAPAYDRAGRLVAIVVGVTAPDCRNGETVLVRYPLGDVTASVATQVRK